LEETLVTNHKQDKLAPKLTNWRTRFDDLESTH